MAWTGEMNFYWFTATGLGSSDGQIPETEAEEQTVREECCDTADNTGSASQKR